MLGLDWEKIMGEESPAEELLSSGSLDFPYWALTKEQIGVGGDLTCPCSSTFKPYHSTPLNPAGLPWRLSGKESACQCRRHGFDPWSRKIPHAAVQLKPMKRNYWCPRPRHCAPQQERSPTRRSQRKPGRSRDPAQPQKDQWGFKKNLAQLPFSSSIFLFKRKREKLLYTSHMWIKWDDKFKTARHSVQNIVDTQDSDWLWLSF